MDAETTFGLASASIDKNSKRATSFKIDAIIKDALMLCSFDA